MATSVDSIGSAVPMAVDTRDDLRILYRELRFLHESVGTDPVKAARTAFAQIRNSFGFECPTAWRHHQPCPPSQAAIDFNYAWRATRKKVAKQPKPIPPCRCGSSDTVTGPGTGNHHASVRCASCSRFLRWLPKGTPIESGSHAVHALGLEVAAHG